MKKPLDGSHVLILDSKNSVFLTQRRDYPIWCFPGGRIEPGETPLKAAVREAQEETGFTLKFSPPHKFGTYVYPSGKRTFFFKTHYLSGYFSPNLEANQGKFFPPGNLPTTFPDPYLQFIRDGLICHGKPFVKKHTFTHSSLLFQFRHRPDIILRYLFFTTLRKLINR